MTRDELLNAIHASRREWDALLEAVSDEAMLSPAEAGGWSVKDVVAHIAWHEREMAGLLRDMTLAGSDLWLLPLHERNAIIHEQSKNRSLEDVRAEAATVYAELLSLLGGLSDEDLNDPSHFKDMPPDWLPWKLIAENTYEHYNDHMDALRHLTARR
jgi:hypothetical protein